MEMNRAKLTDTFDRPLRDLRISVTDRCNFRCVYCMPKDLFGSSHQFLERKKLLSFEEIERIARICVGHGVKKIRVTGGEPLIRREVERLVERLAGLVGLEDLSLTTNAAALTRNKAQRLKDAGLRRITISLDSLDDDAFKAINDVDFPVRRVLQAIENAASVGISPIKINMVVKRGVNEQSVVPMARYFRGTGHIVRFIEYMDVGTSNGWRLDDVVSAAELVETISTEYPIEPATPNYRGEVAKRWRYCDDAGEIGIIASVTQPFCGTCTRARLSADGSLYTCLFATKGYDMRRLLRGDASDEHIAQVIGSIWSRRSDRYSDLRTAERSASPKIEMSYIGG